MEIKLLLTMFIFAFSTSASLLFLIGFYIEKRIFNLRRIEYIIVNIIGGFSLVTFALSGVLLFWELSLLPN